jgi:cysteine synthase A
MTNTQLKMPEDNQSQISFRGKVYEDITQTIGATPLVRLGKLCKEKGLAPNILAKLEFFNPIASVKDRIALSMINEAESAGKITPGKTLLVEPTSGNTGIGLACVAASRGYKLILTMPESMSVERRAMLKIMGADLVLTPAEEGIKGAMAAADKILAENEDAFMPSQFTNPSNPAIHEATTGPEIWQDTNGNIDVLVCGVGTGGTLTGAGRFLKSKNPNLEIVAVEPEDSPVLSGGEHSPHKIQGIGAGFIPEILDMDLIDHIIKVSNDQAVNTARAVAKTEGIPVGISSGAALFAALEFAARPENKDKTIAVIIPSFAERYLSTVLFEDLMA